jgi:hypothetical protein
MFHRLREMAAVDPIQRATAGDMLDKLYGGEGRTTPRNQIRTDPIIPQEAGRDTSEQPMEWDGVAEPNKPSGKAIKAVERPLKEAGAPTMRQRPTRAGTVTVKRPGRSSGTMVRTSALVTPAVNPRVQQRARQAPYP